MYIHTVSIHNILITSTQHLHNIHTAHLRTHCEHQGLVVVVGIDHTHVPHTAEGGGDEDVFGHKQIGDEGEGERGGGRVTELCDCDSVFHGRHCDVTH